MNNLVILSNIINKTNLCIININLKYINNKLYLFGKYGYLKILLVSNLYLDIFYLKQKLYTLWFELNMGWIGILYLNGIGFKSTRKIYTNTKKYWRFNVGHSHVFQYFTPKNILMKVKTRYICIFGKKKNQVLDITKKIKFFHLPDIYKGIGIKFPNEEIVLKKGKMRQ